MIVIWTINNNNNNNNILQGMAGNHVMFMSGFLEECYSMVQFCSCTYQSMQSHSIITPSLFVCLFVFVSYHTMLALFGPRKKTKSDEFRPTLSDPCQWVL